MNQQTFVASTNLTQLIREYQTKLEQLQYREQLVHLRELICDRREQYLNVSNPDVNIHEAFDVEYYLPKIQKCLWLTICPCFHTKQDLQSSINNTEDYFQIPGIFILLNLSQSFSEVDEATILSTLETDQYREFEHYILIENRAYCLTGKGVAKLMNGLEIKENCILYAELQKLQPKFTNMFSYGYH